MKDPNKTKEYCECKYPQVVGSYIQRDGNSPPSDYSECCQICLKRPAPSELHKIEPLTTGSGFILKNQNPSTKECKHEWKYHKNPDDVEYEFCPKCHKIRQVFSPSTPDNVREEEIKKIMYADDIDFTISLKEGSLKYPKPHQLYSKIEETLSLAHSAGKKEGREEMRKELRGDADLFNKKMNDL